MKILNGILLMSPLVLWIIVRCVASLNFSVDCGGHIKRAADANTIELAAQELRTVITYCDEHKLTSGVVSIIIKQPKNDVGFWYTNLKASLTELDKVTETTSQLEKTNILIKLRETLVDHGQSGMSITVPDGITIYPHNVMYFWWAVIGTLLACVGAGLVYQHLSEW
jgi:hypothetical protein